MNLYQAIENNVSVLGLLEAWGIRYWWGEGDPSTPWLNDRKGYDCSGFVQGALVFLGMLDPSAPDRTAYNLAMASQLIQEGDEQLGDMAFYGNPVSHVMLVLGKGIVFGARGGGSSTRGNSATAYVDLKPLRYRKLTCIGRLRA